MKKLKLNAKLKLMVSTFIDGQLVRHPSNIIIFSLAKAKEIEEKKNAQMNRGGKR